MVFVFIYNNFKQRAKEAGLLSPKKKKLINFENDESTKKLTSLRKDFVLEDLPYHVCRIYLIGDNKLDNYWRFPKKLPKKFLALIKPKLVQEFVRNVHCISKWSNKEKYVCLIFKYIYYPLYWYIVKKYKEQKYKAIEKLVWAEQKTLWKDMRTRELSTGSGY